MVDESSHLPIVIVRPSIIACALHEPSPGWIDNLNGATGILAAHYKGILRSIGFHEDLVIDAVPVDTVSNTMIAAGWQRANINDNSVPVIHVTSGQMNPLLLGRYRKCVNESCKKFPLMKQFRSPQITSTKNPMVFEINHFLLHLIPAHFADFVTKLFGGKPILVRVVKRLKYAIQVMQFAIENQWYFASKNIVELRQQMSEEDRKTFNIDIADFTWESYLENYVLGVRQHILQEDPSTIEMARKKAMRYKVFMNLLKTALFVLSLRMLNKKTQIIKRLWHFLLNNALPMLRFVPVVNRAILT
jgi:fatty acyl-CoA reductase